ncbi:coat protein [Mint virus 2]|uniref:Coat protein n=1 Tax=Mint virus 2 TaxID=312998 RepID=Q52V12_9VIRU|nr:coat protein [Mint virus 2]AAX07262.1 coat protein [Mint virus 2]
MCIRQLKSYIQNMEGLSRRSRIRSTITTLLSAGVNFADESSDNGFDRGMYLRTLFGYIALVGTSRKAEHYGEVDIIGNKFSKSSADARGKINIRECVRKMQSFASVVPDGECRGATLRQLCEPFAKEARDCLVILNSWGEQSQLAKKMTKSGHKEPQVMFDFNAGLSLSDLSDEEAAVIQSLNSRLFRSEGAKKVFTAQSSIGEQAVEI